MDSLDITKGEWDNVALMTDFLSKTKLKFNEKSITDFHFHPNNKGYYINFNDNENDIKISLSFKSKVFRNLKITYTKNNQKIKSYKSRNFDKNTIILNEIFKQ